MKRLEDKKFRRAFVGANVRRGIAYQLKAMRLAEQMSQGQVGRKAKKPQNVISRLENPRYGKVSVQTLLELAAAFDVGLLVKFVSFGRLLSETKVLSQETLVPLSFENETKVAKSGFAHTLLQSVQVTADQFATRSVDRKNDPPSLTNQVVRESLSSTQIHPPH
jgi:transcriptional regulator with XRE-family HTH domain